MQVEINLSEGTVRKIKALHVLKNDGVDFEETLSQIIDQVVSIEIASLIGIRIGSGNEPVLSQERAPVENDEGADFGSSVLSEDITGITDGLGDDQLEDGSDREGLTFDDNPAAEDFRAPDNFVPVAEEVVGETAFERQMSQDLALEDPEHEAIAEPQVIQGAAANPTEVFSAHLDLPPPAELDEVPQVARRKVRIARGKTRKATVKPLTNFPAR